MAYSCKIFSMLPIFTFKTIPVSYHRIVEVGRECWHLRTNTWCVQDKETVIMSWPSRKMGVSNKYTGNWCPMPTYVSTSKRYKKVTYYLPKMSFSARASLQEISQTDGTLTGETCLTPDCVMWIIFEVRLFHCWLATVLGVVWWVWYE